MLGRFGRALGTTYRQSLKTNFKSVKNRQQINRYDTKSINNMFLERFRGPSQAQPTQPSLRKIAPHSVGLRKIIVLVLFDWNGFPQTVDIGIHFASKSINYIFSKCCQPPFPEMPATIILRSARSCNFPKCKLLYFFRVPTIIISRNVSPQVYQL